MGVVDALRIGKGLLIPETPSGCHPGMPDDVRGRRRKHGRPRDPPRDGHLAPPAPEGLQMARDDPAGFAVECRIGRNRKDPELGERDGQLDGNESPKSVFIRQVRRLSGDVLRGTPIDEPEDRPFIRPGSGDLEAACEDRGTGGGGVHVKHLFDFRIRNVGSLKPSKWRGIGEVSGGEVGCEVRGVCHPGWVDRVMTELDRVLLSSTRPC